MLTSAPLERSKFRIGSLLGTLAEIMRGVQPLSSYLLYACEQKGPRLS